MEKEQILDKRRKLNVDVPSAITEFEAAAREFELKDKIYRIIFSFNLP